MVRNMKKNDSEEVYSYLHAKSDFQSFLCLFKMEPNHFM